MKSRRSKLAESWISWQQMDWKIKAALKRCNLIWQKMSGGWKEECGV
jgi:hypothetical protein